MLQIHATEDISLGKPQYGNWGHGSNMKSTPSQVNYYSALEHVEDDRRGSRNKNDPGYHSKGPSMERYKNYDGEIFSNSVLIPFFLNQFFLKKMMYLPEIFSLL